MKRIDKIAQNLYEEVLREYNAQGDNTNRKALSVLLNEKLSRYNEEAKAIIEDMVLSAVGANTSFASLPSVVLTGVKLSKRLYKNSEKVAAESLEILHQGIKTKMPIKDMSKKLYDGYSFNDKELLDVKRKLPKYLQRELKRGKVSEELIKYVDNIKTKPYRTALNKIISKLDDTNKIGLQKALQTALEEKSRYYATRIADTESHRARNLSRAKEFLEDEDVKFVKFTMSSRHPMMDICDYYSRLDVGYGAGIVPKEQMITLPLHPHCHCRYHPHYRKPKKRHIANPEKYTMEKFSLRDQQRIVGSFDKLREFKEGKDIVTLFNRVRPHYPIREYSDVFGYNLGMIKFTEKNLTNVEINTITKWTQDSTEIKMTMWGLSKDHVHEANTLFNLFDKYAPNIQNGIKLYRGMSFTKDDFIFYGFHAVSAGDLHTPDEKAIVSFSTNKRQAFEYATSSKSKNYKVFYILEEEKDAFDISSLSYSPFEEENIITKNIWYNVRYIKTYKRGEELWKIIKIIPEKE